MRVSDLIAAFFVLLAATASIADAAAASALACVARSLGQEEPLEAPAPARFRVFEQNPAMGWKLENRINAYAEGKRLDRLANEHLVKCYEDEGLIPRGHGAVVTQGLDQVAGARLYAEDGAGRIHASGIVASNEGPLLIELEAQPSELRDGRIKAFAGFDGQIVEIGRVAMTPPRKGAGLSPTERWDFYIRLLETTLQRLDSSRPAKIIVSVGSARHASRWERMGFKPTDTSVAIRFSGGKARIFEATPESLRAAVDALTERLVQAELKKRKDLAPVADPTIRSRLRSRSVLLDRRLADGSRLEIRAGGKAMLSAPGKKPQLADVEMTYEVLPPAGDGALHAVEVVARGRFGDGRAFELKTYLALARGALRLQRRYVGFESNLAWMRQGGQDFVSASFEKGVEGYEVARSPLANRAMGPGRELTETVRAQVDGKVVVARSPFLAEPIRPTTFRWQGRSIRIADAEILPASLFYADSGAALEELAAEVGRIERPRGTQHRGYPPLQPMFLLKAIRDAFDRQVEWRSVLEELGFRSRSASKR